MFKKILIVNRGEIAVRIIRTCRDLGIASAAVYSEADKNSLHIRLADEAYFIGDSLPSNSYLNIPLLISLAKDINADAIHPGYGFLSENARFIKSIENEGITFIGPSYKSVEMMGDKITAKQLMIKNNVPVVPGSDDPILSIKEGIDIARETGFPVLLKATAGGGGKGMKRVNSENEFAPAFEAAKRESLNAFGNDCLYLEKFIENPKHIEVQIIADKHGNYAHLFERECSIQRRHQKIIEEAPSPSLDSSTRKKITEAGIMAAKACGYYNAGTIEFLMDSNKDFYFMEMNTRLQVEHPVTELITGLDLVKEQINIAAGNKLSFNQKDVKLNGHSVECRIYAEDGDNQFLPSTGKISYYSVPSGPGVRVDAGIETGSEVSLYYDPILAKVATWGADRSSAISRMKRALSEYIIDGVITNISFFEKILSHKHFIDGTFTIHFIEKLLEEKSAKVNNEIENQLSNEEILSIASILLKSKIKKSSNKNHQYPLVTNKWSDLLYE